MVNKEFEVAKLSNWNNLMFCEKIKYYGTKLNHHYSKYVDKLEAKKIIQEICGEEIKTTKILKILNDPNDISSIDISNSCIIKSVHGSGWNIPILSENKKICINQIRNTLNNWDKIYSYTEIQYAYIKPGFFIEEIIDDKYYGKTGDAIVYMIRCIYGKAVSISAYLKNKGKISNYDLNWNVIYKNELSQIEKPKNLDKIIKYAELLSSPFEFVRIDFYIDKKDDIYFSEYTFTPAAGQMIFTKEIEKKLCETWV